uniref:DNA translocase FtsK 4TM domain-containing protein n=1 Tax=Lancefieldella parvula TaxID=1382 RepID=UPI0028E6FE42
MPSKRTSNAAKRNSRNASSAQAVGLSPLQNDIIGVVLAVIAIAMFLSIIVPSNAVITSAMGHGLKLCFGTGALLFPIAVFVFAMTFFMRDDQGISTRIAIGLTLDVLAALALISLNFPGAEAAPDMLLGTKVLEAAGGYVGGGIAWVLLRFVGRVVGNVLLVGFIIAGVVICGFSISDMVERVGFRLDEVRENHRYRKEERALAKEEALYAANVPQPAKKQGRRGANNQSSLFDETGEGETTYLGNRKTSVIKRDARLYEEQEAQEDAGDAPTTLLDKAKNKLRSKKKDQIDDAVVEKDDVAVAEPAPTTKQAKPKSKSKTTPDFLATPNQLKRPGDDDESYELPPFTILKSNKNSATSAVSDDELEATAQRLQATLEEFGLSSQVVGWTAGPSVTTFKISMGEGERVNKITNLEDDIALSLAAKSVRIFAPIPGTSLV